MVKLSAYSNSVTLWTVSWTFCIVFHHLLIQGFQKWGPSAKLGLPKGSWCFPEWRGSLTVGGPTSCTVLRDISLQLCLVLLVLLNAEAGGPSAPADDAHGVFVTVGSKHLSEGDISLKRRMLTLIIPPTSLGRSVRSREQLRAVSARADGECAVNVRTNELN